MCAGVRVACARRARGVCVSCAPRLLQRTHLVEDAAQRPHVALVGVGLVLADLGRHVVRCADHSARCRHRALHNLRDPKVAQLHEVFGDEDVLRLEVAVQDLLGVDVVQRHHQLDEPVEHLGLREVIFLLRPPLDGCREVAALTVGHHDAQAVAVQEVLAVPHDARVVQRAKHLHLLLCVSSLLGAVGLHLNLLQAVVLAVARVPSEVDRPIVATTDFPHAVVVLHHWRASAES